MPVAAALSDRSGIELLLCGGQIRPGDGACSGTHAEAFFADFYAGKAFLGAGGVHPEAGLTDYYPAEAAILRTIIDHSAATYVLADSSKLGVIAVHRVCALDQVTALITDDEENAAASAELAAAGVVLLRALATDYWLAWTSNAGCLGAMARTWSSLESGPVPSKKIPTSAFHRLR